MKILVVIGNRDFRFISLARSLENCGIEIGVSNDPRQEDIDSFSPDIIVHNTNKVILSKAIMINPKVETLQPFIDLGGVKSAKYDSRFATDISYIGSADDFGQTFAKIVSLKRKLKVFYNVPTGGFNYAGLVALEDGPSVNKSSLVSLIPKEDLGYRELDIIASEGNPVKFEEEDQFLSDIADGINGKRFTGKMSKEEIFKSHTNFDRMSVVLKDNGLTKLAEKIKKSKDKV